jgi:hypothetical protein
MAAAIGDAVTRATIPSHLTVAAEGWVFDLTLARGEA